MRTSTFHRSRAGRNDVPTFLRFSFSNLFPFHLAGLAQTSTARTSRTHCEISISTWASSRTSDTSRWSTKSKKVKLNFGERVATNYHQFYSVALGSHSIRLHAGRHPIARRVRLSVQQRLALQARGHHVALHSWSLSVVGGETKGECHERKGIPKQIFDLSILFANGPQPSMKSINSAMRAAFRSVPVAPINAQLCSLFAALFHSGMPRR